MARRNDRRRPNRQATRKQPSRRRHDRQVDDPALQPLMVELRQAMRAETPWPLVELCSGIISALVDHDADEPPSTSGGGAAPRPTVAQLVDSFMDIDLAETTAALHVFAELLAGDDLLFARIRRTLAARRQPMPATVTTLGDLRVPTAYVAGDGGAAHVILELTGPGVPPAHLLVYVDHLMGTVVRDCFAVPGDEAELRAMVRAAGEAEGYLPELRHLTPADARALLEEALADGGGPPLDSTAGEPQRWPANRPLLEAVVRHLPTGGAGLDPVWLDASDGVSSEQAELDEAATLLAQRHLDARPDARRGRGVAGYPTDPGAGRAGPPPI